MPDDDLERCHIAALRILGYRWNSAAELRRKLASKRFDDDVIDATITRLHAEKWLDDERFAEALVRTKSNRRLGRARIRGELRAAGVDRDTAEEALRDHLDPEKEAEGLKAACERRMRLLTRRHGADYLDSDEGRNNLTGWLLKQGYDAALIREIVAAARGQN